MSFIVFSCESANEIWHKLKVVYESTNQVKESKFQSYECLVLKIYIAACLL